MHTDLILYRVPGEQATLDLLDAARRLGVPSFWEVDDLVFDTALYAENANLRTLPPDQRQNLLHGASLYRTAMLAADRTIASTALLARLMGEASGKPSLLVANALDDETLRAAAEARPRAARLPRTDGALVIAYGSGGALDTVVAGETGVFFATPDVDALVEAIGRFEAIEANFDPERIRRHARGFGRDVFRARMKAFIDGHLEAHLAARTRALAAPPAHAAAPAAFAEAAE